jgi:hypothetical protein
MLTTINYQLSTVNQQRKNNKLTQYEKYNHQSPITNQRYQTSIPKA